MAAPDGWWAVDAWERCPGPLGHERRRREFRTLREATDWAEALRLAGGRVTWYEDERRISVLFD